MACPSRLLRGKSRAGLAPTLKRDVGTFGIKEMGRLPKTAHRRPEIEDRKMEREDQNFGEANSGSNNPILLIGSTCHASCSAQGSPEQRKIFIKGEATVAPVAPNADRRRWNK